MSEEVVPNHITCTWTGASGKKYVYEVYARHPKLAPNEPGNYIYANGRAQEMGADPYRCRQLDAARTDRRRVDCINAKGATHVHVHVNSDRDDREAEVRDLLKNFPQAYAPDGCNEEEGS